VTLTGVYNMAQTRLPKDSNQVSSASPSATVKIKDVMRTPVYTIEEDEHIDRAAKIMCDQEIGSIVVVDEDKNPVGIITERDIVRRVVVHNTVPSLVKAKDIMSSPLATVPPEYSLDEAAKIMNKLNVRRLLVMDKGKMVGIVSSKEIIQVTPTLLEIIQEKAKAGVITPVRGGLPLAGYCDSCGQWSDMLTEANGSFVCEECVAEQGEQA